MSAEPLLRLLLDGDPALRAQGRELARALPEMGLRARLVLATERLLLEAGEVPSGGYIAGRAYRRWKRRVDDDRQRRIHRVEDTVSCLPAPLWAEVQEPSKLIVSRGDIPSIVQIWTPEEDTGARKAWEGSAQIDVDIEAPPRSDTYGARWMVRPIRPGGPLRARVLFLLEIPF